MESAGLVTLLGVAFIILKLCGVIMWPWVWVLAPFWMSAIIVVVAFVAIAVIALSQLG